MRFGYCSREIFHALILVFLFGFSVDSYSKNEPSLPSRLDDITSLVKYVPFPVKGVVVDDKGNILSGVTILIKGTSLGVQTDFDGKFAISVDEGQVLVFKYLGFKTKEVVVSGQDALNIVMEEEISELDSAVVTGYRKIKTTEFSGSAVTLKASKVQIGGVSTIDKMLQGQVAGVQVTTSSSVFGAAPRIRIRGSSSISGINSPLWVLDGVVLQRPINVNPSQLYSGTARNLLSSVLGGINPNDIDSITVLKDATATALYGTRAVNGVIVITTKRGVRNQPLKLSYNTLLSYNLKPTIDKFNVANSKVETDVHEQLYDIFQAELLNYSANNQGALTKLINERNSKNITKAQYLEDLRRIKGVNTDWFDVLFKNNITQQHSLSATFGGDKTAGRASFSFYTDPGFSLGQNVSRYTLNLSEKITFNEKFSAELLVKYSDRSQRNSGTRVNPYSFASTASRAMRPYSDNGDLEYYKKDYADFNIINEIDNDYIDIKAKDLNAQIQLNYNPLDFLKFKLLANRTTVTSSIISAQTENSAYAQSFRTTNFNIIDRNDRLYQDPDKPSNALPETTLPYGGILNSNNIETLTNTFRFQGDYTILDNSLHNLNVFAGSEIINNESNEVQFTGYGYIFQTGTSFPSELALKKSIRNQENDSENRGDNYYGTYVFRRNQVSVYGSMIYNLLKKYNLTFSFRNDATNVSGTSTGNRFLPTYTVAGSWLMHEEAFMKRQNVFTRLKLRASYGLRGNAGSRGPDVIANYRNISRIYPEYNVLAVGLDEPEISDLEFEKEYIVNLGIDMSFLKFFNLTANYYHRKNFDLVGPRSVPLSVGYDVKTINWAIMTNEGYELALRTDPFKISKDFSVSGSFNIGYNKNEIVSNYIGNNPTIFDASVIEGYPFRGRPLTGLYSFKFAGLDSNGLAQYYNSGGNSVYGFSTSDKEYGSIEYQGSRDPLYSGGFSTTFTYKNLSLTAFFSYVAGNVVRKPGLYRSTYFYTLATDQYNLSKDIENRWENFGNEQYTNVPRLLDNKDREFYQNQGILGNQYTSYNRSDIRTVDASYLRLRNVSLKYNLPKKMTDFLKLDYMSAQFQGTNLLLFASEKLNGQDPETLIQGTNIPPVTSFTLGVNVGF